MLLCNIWIKEFLKQRMEDYMLQTSQSVVQSSEHSHKLPAHHRSSTTSIISIDNLSFTCIYTFGTISPMHDTYAE
jgi:hypothetical protein